MLRPRLKTPNTPPDENIVRRIVIPAELEWRGLLNAALIELTKPENYRIAGNLSPEQAAEYWRGVMEAMTDEPE